MTAADSVDRVRVALEAIRARIDAVERTWSHEVEITAVTKAHPGEVILDAVAAGCRAIGENYAQELLSKRSTIESLAADVRPRVDFIGRLQTNKVRQLAGVVDRWASVDRADLVDEIARRDPNGHVLVQVNTTFEVGKGGCRVEDAAALVERCRDRGLQVDGLMTVGPTDAPAAQAMHGFGVVRSLVDQLGLSVCSMGMTGDLEQAVASGATTVRIGSALFGSRGDVKSQPVHPKRTDLG